MLSQVSVRNFKAIGGKSVTLDLAPLTLIVGPNAAGKSSMLDAIVLMAQSTRPPQWTGLLTNGARQTFGPVENLYHRCDPTNAMRIELRWARRDSTPVGAWFEVANAKTGDPGEWKQGLAAGNSAIRFENMPGSVQAYAAFNGKVDGKVTVGGSVQRFLDPGLLNAASQSQAEQLAPWRDDVAERLAAFLTSTQLRYIGPMRGGSVMKLDAQGVAAQAGRFGEDTIRLLSTVELRVDPERRQWLKATAERFGLSDLTAGFAGDGTLGARFSDPRTHASLPVTSAGFASQQLLPILADLAHLKSGGTLLVEEIEHSTHPAWIAALGATLAEAVADLDTQIVATTHAPDLLLSAALAVKERVIGPEALAIWEMTRDAAGVRARRWNVDSKGRFEEGWVQSFAAAEKSLLGKLLEEDAKAEANGNKPKRRTAPRSARSR